MFNIQIHACYLQIQVTGIFYVLVATVKLKSSSILMEYCF